MILPIAKLLRPEVGTAFFVLDLFKVRKLIVIITICLPAKMFYGLISKV